MTSEQGPPLKEVAELLFHIFQMPSPLPFPSCGLSVVVQSPYWLFSLFIEFWRTPPQAFTSTVILFLSLKDNKCLGSRQKSLNLSSAPIGFLLQRTLDHHLLLYQDLRLKRIPFTFYYFQSFFSIIFFLFVEYLNMLKFPFSLKILISLHPSSSMTPIVPYPHGHSLMCHASSVSSSLLLSLT